MTDEPLEKLVARRIREQLGEGGLENLIEAQRRIGRIEGQAQELRIEVGLEAAGAVGFPEVIQAAPPGEALAVIESASPELANDMRGRGQPDLNLAINLYVAIITTLEFLLHFYEFVHHQPPTQIQIIEIFNHTTNVINQTTTTVINMPPHN